eukprot:CAMPEP_0194277344 /NCGR_PEP_ID=MMETSP0169-20130528/9702_1 /TAXON_ID=218684 /ORGANISM="Corethron pennatum, Strain L29A3" /LENGTH=555 /DNA_ID=CAMNT_0039021295 /DNA_START=290 /DNA_END=1957 /DNA_ORIENTATION=-
MMVATCVVRIFQFPLNNWLNAISDEAIVQKYYSKGFKMPKIVEQQKNTTKHVHNRMKHKDLRPGEYSTGPDGARIPLPFWKTVDKSHTNHSRKIILLGLLGTGSRYLAGYFHCAGVATSHSTCRTGWKDSHFNCGACVEDNVRNGSQPFQNCGTYDVWGQLGYLEVNKNATTRKVKGKIIPELHIPQLEYIEQLVKIDNVSFVLTQRYSATVWATAIMDKYALHQSFINSDIPDFPRGKGINIEELVEFYRAYKAKVISIVGRKNLIILNTDKHNIAKDMRNRFGIKEKCWGSKIEVGKNVYKNKPQEKFSISSGGTRMSLPFDSSNPSPPVLKLPTPVISLGFPKTGTTSIFHYFHCGKFPSSHYRCANKLSSKKAGRFRCGDCVQNNIGNGNPMFKSCGSFDVWAEINSSNIYDKVPTIFLPQVEHLNAIHENYPNATFVLTKRDPEEWISSVMNWHKLHQLFINTNITGLPAGSGKTSDELQKFLKGHMYRIREFVRRHPSHTLIEVDINDKNVGNILEDAFGIDAKCWSQSNVGSYHVGAGLGTGTVGMKI